MSQRHPSLRSKWPGLTLLFKMREHDPSDTFVDSVWGYTWQPRDATPDPIEINNKPILAPEGAGKSIIEGGGLPSYDDGLEAAGTLASLAGTIPIGNNVLAVGVFTLASDTSPAAEFAIGDYNSGFDSMGFWQNTTGNFRVYSLYEGNNFDAFTPAAFGLVYVSWYATDHGDTGVNATIRTIWDEEAAVLHTDSYAYEMDFGAGQSFFFGIQETTLGEECCHGVMLYDLGNTTLTEAEQRAIGEHCRSTWADPTVDVTPGSMLIGV